MIAARALFMYLIPELIHMSTILAAAVTAFWAQLVLVLDAIKAAIFGIVELIAGIDHLFHGHMKKPNVPNFLAPRVISAKEVRRELTLIAETCQHYAGLKPIFNHIVRDLASPTVCPLLRAVYPLGPDTIYKFAKGALGWLSYESEPYPGGNCPLPTKGPEWVCVGIGFGYILLELFVPMLIGGIFLYSCKKGIARIVSLLGSAVVTTLELAGEIFFKVLSKV